MIIRYRSIYRVLLCIFIVLLIIILYSTTQPTSHYHDDYISVDTIPEIEEEIKPNVLINLTDFNYTIEGKVCKNYGRDILGVIIVTSYVGHDELRAAHRQAIPQSKLVEMGFVRVFLLAQIPAEEKYIAQAQVKDEQRKFGDLLQGNFLEAYRNLTYKHIMGLKWAGIRCYMTKFIIKIDDDIVFDVFHLKNYLEGLEIRGFPKTFIAGYTFENMAPVRLVASKWFAKFEEFDGDIYPDFVSGWLYITNPSTALQLVHRSQTEQPFWIDDIWVTGIIRQQIEIPLIKINSWYTPSEGFIECCVRDLKTYAYECEYFVGPNGGETKRIVEFLHLVEKCYFDECNKRPPKHTLKKTCVSAPKRKISDHGDALVREIRL